MSSLRENEPKSATNPSTISEKREIEITSMELNTRADTNESDEEIRANIPKRSNKSIFRPIIKPKYSHRCFYTILVLKVFVCALFAALFYFQNFNLPFAIFESFEILVYIIAMICAIKSSAKILRATVVLMKVVILGNVISCVYFALRSISVISKFSQGWDKEAESSDSKKFYGVLAIVCFLQIILPFLVTIYSTRLYKKIENAGKK
jgi:hypothetical protein